MEQRKPKVVVSTGILQHQLLQLTCPVLPHVWPFSFCFVTAAKISGPAWKRALLVTELTLTESQMQTSWFRWSSPSTVPSSDVSQDWGNSDKHMETN